MLKGIIKEKIILFVACSLLCFAGAAAQATGTVHIVKPGETLYSISKMYNTTIEQIKASNPTEATENLKSNSKIVIPTSGNDCIFYEIKKHDTLYSLSKKYDVSTEAILKANPGLSESTFKAGTTIKIPVSRFIVTKVDTTGDSRPVGIAGTNCKEMHKTEKGETLSSIAAKYNVSLSELQKANPDIVDATKKIHKGTFVCIPYAEEKQAAPSSDITAPAAHKEKILKSDTSYNVTLLMPFYNDDARYVDFYRGLLYAISKLRETGTSFRIEAHNAGQSVTDINKLLQEPSIAKSDVIISAASEAVSNIISDFCAAHGIAMYLPFSTAFDAVYNNPNVTMSNAPASYASSIVNNYFITAYASSKKHNVVCFDCGGDSSPLSRNLLQALSEAGIKVNKINTESSAEDVKKALSTKMPNVIFSTSPLKSDYLKLHSILETSKSIIPSGTDISIFGYDSWKDFDIPTRDTFYEYGVTLSTSEFINVFSPIYSISRKFYIDNFGKGAAPSVYAQRAFYLGFDSANLLFGSSEPSISKSFNLKRVTTWGGRINRSARIVKFTKNKTIVINDYDN